MGTMKTSPDDAANNNDLGRPSSLGLCCICETTLGVRNIVILNAQAPVLGHGWGCVVCGLEPHGALAVICDGCEALYHQPGKSVEDRLRFVCRGRPGSDGRMPIADLCGEHGHDWSQHPEATQVPPLTVAKTDTRFPSQIEDGQGCHCSRCGKTIWKGTTTIRFLARSGPWQYFYHSTCQGAMRILEHYYEDRDDGNDDDCL